MISVPAKETEPADWPGFLRAYLTSVYGSAAEFEPAISALHQQRQAVLGAPQHAQGRDVLYRYYGQLELLGLRIPSVRMSFSWRALEEIGGGLWVTQQSIAYEKACVLFNLAAAFSAIGTAAAAGSEPKLAYAPFQAAAGVFRFVAENFLHAPTPDLSPELMAALETLMLAQAQHAFWMKAAQSSSTKEGLRAKLAAAAAHLYIQASESLHIHGGNTDWSREAASAAQSLRRHAHLDWGIHLENTGKHGLALAHLREARQIAVPGDDDSSKDLVATIKTLERDNDLVWHDKIPADAGTVPMTQTAKPTSMEALYSTPAESARVVGRDLFSKVVPLAVHEKASLYSEKQAELVRSETDKAEIADQELRSALEYMELPRAAEALRKNSSFSSDLSVPPDELIGVSISPIDLDMEPQRQRILGLCQAITDPGRAQQIKQSLVTAGDTDKRLRDMWKDVHNDVQTLEDPVALRKVFEIPSVESGPPVDLLSLDDTSSSSNVDTQIQSVMDAVAQLRKVETERKTALRELRDRIHSDDISNVLVTHQSTNNLDEAVFKPELAKYAPITKRIDATIRLQASLLESVASTWRSVLASPTVKQRASATESARRHHAELTTRFGTALRTAQAVQDGVHRAHEFYTQLEQMALGGIGTTGSSTQVSLPPQHTSVSPAPSSGSSGPSLGSVTSKPPPLPPKTTESGYSVPSAYNPSFYS